eukprot:357839-Chlamydomonas_euryale.AAC.5
MRLASLLPNPHDPTPAAHLRMLLNCSELCRGALFAGQSEARDGGGGGGRRGGDAWARSPACQHGPSPEPSKSSLAHPRRRGAIHDKQARVRTSIDCPRQFGACEARGGRDGGGDEGASGSALASLLPWPVGPEPEAVNGPEMTTAMAPAASARQQHVREAALDTWHRSRGVATAAADTGAASEAAAAADANALLDYKW